MDVTEISAIYVSSDNKEDAYSLGIKRRVQLWRLVPRYTIEQTIKYYFRKYPTEINSTTKLNMYSNAEIFDILCGIEIHLEKKGLMWIKIPTVTQAHSDMDKVVKKGWIKLDEKDYDMIGDLIKAEQSAAAGTRLLPTRQELEAESKIKAIDLLQKLLEGASDTRN